MKKFTFDDLQPHVDMLCDALENRGASSSGIPNEAVYPQAKAYRNVLSKIRSKSITGYDLEMLLHALKNETLALAKNNQYHRIDKIASALDFYLRKEYHKYKN